MTAAVDQALALLSNEIVGALQGTHGGYALGAAELSRSIGLYRKHGKGGINDGIAQGVLNRLADKGVVERAPQQNGRGGWRLK